MADSLGDAYFWFRPPRLRRTRVPATDAGAAGDAVVVNLVDVTRRAMVETPGIGDSVEELADVWGDLDVSGIHDAVLRERARALWDTVSAGANPFLTYESMGVIP